MGNIIRNKRGASLIEIVATVAIVAISLTTIYSVLDFSLKQNGINQDKTINVNVANGVLNYIRNSDYDTLYNELYPDGQVSPKYVQINELRCSDIYQDDQNICNTILAPTINNRNYNHENLNVFILPYNDISILNDLKTTPPAEFPPVLVNYLDELDTETPKEDYRNIIRIVVVVNSSIKTKHDILLEGVIIDEIE